MTDRDELIEAGWQAWLKADSIHSGVEAVIDAVEPPIRADERERLDIFAARAVSAERQVLTDLRAKVEALHRCVIDGEPHVRRGDVLALFKDGASDE
jgi:hypothetical protein